MYKDDYISAFGKLALSEEWMADTLAKMRPAEAEQEAPGAAGPAGRPALRVSGKKHPRLRRAALPVAAAVALLAVPAAWFWGVAMRPAGSAAKLSEASCTSRGEKRAASVVLACSSAALASSSAAFRSFSVSSCSPSACFFAVSSASLPNCSSRPRLWSS